MATEHAYQGDIHKGSFGDAQELQRNSEESSGPCGKLNRKWIIVIGVAIVLVLAGLITTIVMVTRDSDDSDVDLSDIETFDHSKALMSEILDTEASEKQLETGLLDLVNYQEFLLRAPDSAFRPGITQRQINAWIDQGTTEDAAEAGEGAARRLLNAEPGTLPSAPGLRGAAEMAQRLTRFQANVYKLLGVDSELVDGVSGTLVDDVDVGAKSIAALTGDGGPPSLSFAKLSRGLSTVAPYFALVDDAYEIVGLSLGGAATGVEQMRSAFAEHTQQVTAELEAAAASVQTSIQIAEDELAGRLKDGDIIQQFIRPTDGLRTDLYAYKNGIVSAWDDRSFVGPDAFCDFHAWCVGDGNKPTPIEIGRAVNALIKNGPNGGYLVGLAAAFLGEARTAREEVARLGMDLLTRLGYLQQAAATCHSAQRLVSEQGPEDLVGKCGSARSAPFAGESVRLYDELTMVSSTAAEFLDYEMSTVLPAKRALVDTYSHVRQGECETRREDEDSPSCGTFRCYWRVDALAVEIFEYYEAGPHPLKLMVVTDRRGPEPGRDRRDRELRGPDSNDVYMQLPDRERQRLQDGERMCEREVDEAFIDLVTIDQPPSSIFANATMKQPVNFGFSVGPEFEQSVAYKLDDYSGRRGTVHLYIHTRYIESEHLAQSVPLLINFVDECPDDPLPTWEMEVSEEDVDKQKAGLSEGLRGSLIVRNIKRFELTCELVMSAAYRFVQLPVLLVVSALLLLSL